jgi:hypothetical protein
MSLIEVSQGSAWMDWSHSEGASSGSDDRTHAARRETLRRRARLHLANYFAEGEQTDPMVKETAPVETADDIDFGRSDCEFLFRD